MRVKRETFLTKIVAVIRYHWLLFEIFVIEIDCKFHEQKKKERHKNIGPFFFDFIDEFFLFRENKIVFIV